MDLVIFWANLGIFWVCLGTFWVDLGMFWADLVMFRVDLGYFGQIWGYFGVFGGILDGLRDILDGFEDIWVDLGDILGRFGDISVDLGIFGWIWGYFRWIWGYLGKFGAVRALWAGLALRPRPRPATKTTPCLAWPRPLRKPRPLPSQPIPAISHHTSPALLSRYRLAGDPPPFLHPAPRSYWLLLRPPRSPIGPTPRGRARPSHPAPPLAAARASLCARRFEGARDKMAAPPQAGPAAPPEPRPRLSRLPVGRAQEKRAPSEGPPAAPPQQKRSRTGLGPGAAKAAPKAPLRAPLRTLGAAAGKNDGPRKAASVAAAPRAGSVTSTSSKGASKRPPWDLRGQLGDLREALARPRSSCRGCRARNRSWRAATER
ncbi:uncharacterized protein VK521_016744 [Ammospiza maritima maritima]